MIDHNLLQKDPNIISIVNTANNKSIQKLTAFCRSLNLESLPTEVLDTINTRRWKIKFDYPEFYYDTKTGEKIIVKDFRQIHPDHLKYKKLRLFNTGLEMLLNFVKFSLYVDLDKNINKTDSENLEIDFHKTNPPLLLLKDEEDEINNVTNSFALDYRTSSWQNKKSVFKYNPSERTFTLDNEFTKQHGNLKSENEASAVMFDKYFVCLLYTSRCV